MTAYALTSVDFHGDLLWAGEADGEAHLAIKAICRRLGLDWSSQSKRLHRHEVLSEGMVITTIPSAGGPQQTTPAAPRSAEWLAVWH